MSISYLDDVINQVAEAKVSLHSKMQILLIVTVSAFDIKQWCVKGLLQCTVCVDRWRGQDECIMVSFQE